MAQLVGLTMAVTGGMMFLISFIGFKPPGAMLQKEGDEDADKEREMLLTVMRVMRRGFRIIAALAAFIGLIVYWASGGTFDNIFN